MMWRLGGADISSPYLVIAFEELYGKIARREMLAHYRRGLDGVDELAHGELNVVAEASRARWRTVSRGLV